MTAFTFRCLNGDTVTVEAVDEAAARAAAMERRWGPPEYNRTWACSHWYGAGLNLIEGRV